MSEVAIPPAVLPRSIGVVGGTLLTLSCLTPASSLFVVVPSLLSHTGTGTLLVIVVAAVLCAGVALCYAELAALVPSAGGEYAMAAVLAGRFAGWLMFVLSLVSVMVIPPIIALGTAGYLAAVVDASPQATGATVMVVATLTGLLNLRANAWITGVFLALEVVTVAVVSFLGLVHVERPLSVLVDLEVGRAGAGVDALAIITALGGALFVLQGFTSAVYLSEEMRDPRRTVVRTVMWTLAIGAGLIMAPVLAIILGAPDIVTLSGGDVAGMTAGWSNSCIATFVSLSIALAIANAVIVIVIQNSRVLFASARDRAWPGVVSRALGTVSGRFGSPWVATLAVGLGGAALTFAPVETLTGVTSVVVTATYLGVAVTALVARRSLFTGALAWRMRGWPVLPALISLALACVLAQQRAADLVIVLVTLILASGYWVTYLRRRPADRWIVTVVPD
ncbi:APC family permease [Lentzea sp. NEAU-D7]|uniref:APC family permease n=1 Tax=Lentzea sp. NEAU-D7 TaxID=2994667 RepID=UPI00224B86C7|nr:APC family permease [Lentzea sp. NEAU-D7]MCX2954543.1 APC family permease [Lentzea sp. NEAU-D7]